MSESKSAKQLYPMKMPGMFSSMQSRDYRLLWWIATLTNAALWSHIMVTGWSIFETTQSSFWVGANMFAALLPNLLGGPIAGVLSDRMSRKRLISLDIGASFFVQLLLAVYSYTAGQSTVIVVILFTYIFGTSMSIMGVALNALLPGLVPKKDLFNAISLQAVAQRGTEFIGPLLSGWILAQSGIEDVFLFCAALNAASWFVSRRISVPTDSAAFVNGAVFFRSLAEGFHYIHQVPVIRILMIAVALHCGLTMSYMGVLPELAKSRLAGDSELYSRMVSYIGLGAVIGTLILAVVRNEKRRGELYLATGLLSSLTLMALAAAHQEWTILLSAAGVGLSQAVFMTLSVSFIQDVVEERLRGRVMSVFLLLAAGLMSVANWAYGGLVRKLPPDQILLLLGGLFTGAVLIMLLSSAVFRTICLGQRNSLQTSRSISS